MRTIGTLRPAPVRFWERVGKTDTCWVWLGHRTSRGYGRFEPRTEVPRKYITAHRFSWEMHNGPAPEGLCILHRCDNRPCVNPAHLFLGTVEDNNNDREAKGRSNRGEFGSLLARIHQYQRDTGERVEFFASNDFSRLSLTIDGDHQRDWTIGGARRARRFEAGLAIALHWQAADVPADNRSTEAA